MPPTKKPTKRVDIKILPSEYTLPCEWEGCKDVFSTMEDFLNHVAADHLKHVPSENPVQGDDPNEGGNAGIKIIVTYSNRHMI